MFYIQNIDITVFDILKSCPEMNPLKILFYFIFRGFKKSVLEPIETPLSPSTHISYLTYQLWTSPALIDFSQPEHISCWNSPNGTTRLYPRLLRDDNVKSCNRLHPNLNYLIISYRQNGKRSSRYSHKKTCLSHQVKQS